MVSHVHICLTVTRVRAKLSHQDDAMMQKDAIIELFNDDVIGLVSQLHADEHFQNAVANAAFTPFRIRQET